MRSSIRAATRTGEPGNETTDAATCAERTAAIIAFVEGAHRRAEEMARDAQMHSDRLEAAREYAHQARERITGHSPGRQPTRPAPC